MMLFQSPLRCYFRMIINLSARNNNRSRIKAAINYSLHNFSINLWYIYHLKIYLLFSFLKRDLDRYIAVFLFAILSKHQLMTADTPRRVNLRKFPRNPSPEQSEDGPAGLRRRSRANDIAKTARTSWNVFDLQFKYRNKVANLFYRKIFRLCYFTRSSCIYNSTFSL